MLSFSFKRSILKGLLGKPGSYIHLYGQIKSISSVNCQVRVHPSWSTGTIFWIFLCNLGIMLTIQRIYTRLILVAASILNSVCFFSHWIGFRYPYYMLSCIGIEWKPLTWLRYTVWIPLYPLGGLAEGMSKNGSLINNEVKVGQITQFLVWLLD